MGSRISWGFSILPNFLPPPAHRRGLNESNMRDITLSELQELQPQAADDALQMDHETFRVLYERTARSLWVFLWRRTGDTQLADDLLQESYYRLLRSRTTHESEAHRRN